jgi:hypothetical protein
MESTLPLRLVGCTIKVVDKIKDAAVELLRLRDYLESCPLTERLLGLDCEWLQGQKGSNIDLIQLCVGFQGSEDIVLIRTNARGQKKCPPGLVPLLAMEGVRIGGNKVQGDLTRMAKYYGESSLARSNTICDLSNLAMERGVTVYGKGENTLANLCRRVLGVHLLKPTAARDSDWRCSSLSKEQIEYAALDALASLRILKGLLLMRDLTVPLQLQEALPGVIVDICPLEGSRMCRAASAGKGIIVSEPLHNPSLPPGLQVSCDSVVGLV